MHGRTRCYLVQPYMPYNGHAPESIAGYIKACYVQTKPKPKPKKRAKRTLNFSDESDAQLSESEDDEYERGESEGGDDSESESDHSVHVEVLEKIIGAKGPDNKRLYLCTWVGFPDAKDNTWEPTKNLTGDPVYTAYQLELKALVTRSR